MDDIAPLVQAYTDPDLRRWTSSSIDSEADGLQWLQAEQRGWAEGRRFGFAVLESRSDSALPQLVGHVIVKDIELGKPSAEVGYWTAAHARGRGVAARALEVITVWCFCAFRADGLERLELLHQADNLASCRVAQKNSYEFERILPAAPPSYPLDGHLHVRRADA